MSGATATGCSLLYDLTPTQCAIDDDCRARGDAFADTICQSGVCTTPSQATGGEGGGGGGAPPECGANEECIDKLLGSPAICRDAKCLPLTSGSDCPIILGAGQNDENLIDGDPIIIGAYSYVDPISPRQSVPTLNYELAINEFNARTLGGLPGGAGGKLRPIVAVVCAATNSPKFDKSAEHLVGALKVPAILSSIYSSDLLKVFSAYGKPNKVMFLSPLGADSTLEAAADDGLMWHMLGTSTDLAPILTPLVPKVESYLRNQHSLGADDKLRVALVEAKTTFLSDLADFAYSSVEYNGASAKTNEAQGTFLRVRVDSSLEVASPDVADAYAELRSFAPHLIIAMGSAELVGLFTNLEVNWDSPKGPPPFYILSPDLFGRRDVSEFVVNFATGRALGFNYAAAEDTKVYDSYFSRLTTEYAVEFPLEGGENYYDAAYFAMYALAAASTQGGITGPNAAAALPRLMQGSQTFEVGPKAVASVIAFLNQQTAPSFSLLGAMGPPSFHLETGARSMLPSVYCVDGQGTFLQNAATYDPEQQSLEGSPPCVEGFPE